jgi:L-ascorbate metabolism protein UlaG (beta-lactamase superfamily)
MRIRWYGQSAFRLSGERTIMIDPFRSDAEAEAASMGLKFEYPPIEDGPADLLLITHEHFDHNGAEAILCSGPAIRSTAGRFDSPVGDVIAVASEHDRVAGTELGPNTIFRFELDGLVCCHLGDFGQSELRPAQLRALGEPDLVMIPAGGFSTIGGEVAAAVARALNPRLVVAMHFRTDAIDFLEPPDAFLNAVSGNVQQLPASEFDPSEVLGSRQRPTVVVLAPPLAVACQP